MLENLPFGNRFIPFGSDCTHAIDFSLLKYYTTLTMIKQVLNREIQPHG